jgi:hypothetical protein
VQLIAVDSLNSQVSEEKEKEEEESLGIPKQ